MSALEHPGWTGECLADRAPVLPDWQNPPAEQRVFTLCSPPAPGAPGVFSHFVLGFHTLFCRSSRDSGTKSQMPFRGESAVEAWSIGSQRSQNFAQRGHRREFRCETMLQKVASKLRKLWAAPVLALCVGSDELSALSSDVESATIGRPKESVTTAIAGDGTCAYSGRYHGVLVGKVLGERLSLMIGTPT